MDRMKISFGNGPEAGTWLDRRIIGPGAKVSVGEFKRRSKDGRYFSATIVSSFERPSLAENLP